MAQVKALFDVIQHNINGPNRQGVGGEAWVLIHGVQ